MPAVAGRAPATRTESGQHSPRYTYRCYRREVGVVGCEAGEPWTKGGCPACAVSESPKVRSPGLAARLPFGEYGPRCYLSPRPSVSRIGQGLGELLAREVGPAGAVADLAPCANTSPAQSFTLPPVSAQVWAPPPPAPLAPPKGCGHPGHDVVSAGCPVAVVCSVEGVSHAGSTRLTG